MTCPSILSFSALFGRVGGPVPLDLRLCEWLSCPKLFSSAEDGDVRMTLKVYGTSSQIGVRQEIETYLHKKLTLKESLLNIFWVTIFPFIQESEPVV